MKKEGSWQEEVRNYGRDFLIGGLVSWLKYEPKNPSVKNFISEISSPKKCMEAGRLMKAGVMYDGGDKDGFSSWFVKAEVANVKGNKDFVTPIIAKKILEAYGGQYEYDWLLEGQTGYWAGRIFDTKKKKEVKGTRYKTKDLETLATACFLKIAKDIIKKDKKTSDRK